MIELESVPHFDPRRRIAGPEFFGEHGCFFLRRVQIAGHRDHANQQPPLVDRVRMLAQVIAQHLHRIALAPLVHEQARPLRRGRRIRGAALNGD